jgi:hypothetical protein
MTRKHSARQDFEQRHSTAQSTESMPEVSPNVLVLASVRPAAVICSHGLQIPQESTRVAALSIAGLFVPKPTPLAPYLVHVLADLQLGVP